MTVKQWSISTKLQDITPYKTVIFIVITVEPQIATYSGVL
jgi:hypothetical protein